jgi:hypothetical protein
MPSLLARQFELPALGEDGFLVQSGSPARYLPDGFPRSAVRALARRRVPLLVAKQAIEAVLRRREVVVDVPMVEDAAAFERELAELGVRASLCAPELREPDAVSAKSRRG